MEFSEGTLLILLIILFFGLVVPELFFRLRLPYVTSLIIAGALLGPGGFDLVTLDPVIELFGFLGFTFLMLLAGLETNIGELRKNGGRIAIMAALNGIIPFVAGVVVVWLFGFPLVSALLMGIIFISSSVALIIPSIRESGLFKKREGQMMISAVLLEDLSSLFLLAILFQSVAPVTRFPLPIYFFLLIFSVVILWWGIPWLSRLFLQGVRAGSHQEHEDQLRYVIVLLIGVLVWFSALGVHPIVGAFLVGLFLSRVVTSRALKTKIHTLGYGLFVPVFFFIVGAQMDLWALGSSMNHVWLVLAVVAAFVVSKLFSGLLAGKLAGMSTQHQWFFGIVSLPQLTTTLAATYAAAQAGFIDQTLTTTILLLSILTTIISPITLRFLVPTKELSSTHE